MEKKQTGSSRDQREGFCFVCFVGVGEDRIKELQPVSFSGDSGALQRQSQYGREEAELTTLKSQYV